MSFLDILDPEGTYAAVCPNCGERQPYRPRKRRVVDGRRMTCDGCGEQVEPDIGPRMR